MKEFLIEVWYIIKFVAVVVLFFTILNLFNNQHTNEYTIYDDGYMEICGGEYFLSEYTYDKNTVDTKNFARDVSEWCEESFKEKYEIEN